MTRRLGTVAVEQHGKAVLFVLLADGRAACRHVAVGAISVSTGRGMLGAPRFRKEPFAIHRCAECQSKLPGKETPA